jgi:hypothetical protein
LRFLFFLKKIIVNKCKKYSVLAFPALAPTISGALFFTPNVSTENSQRPASFVQVSALAVSAPLLLFNTKLYDFVMSKDESQGQMDFYFTKLSAVA